MKKQWKVVRGDVPTHGKLQLPNIGEDHVYLDRLTGIVWKYNSFDKWSYFEPPKLRPKLPSLAFADWNLLYDVVHSYETGDDVDDTVSSRRQNIKRLHEILDRLK